MEKRIPDFTMEQMLLGELPEDLAREVAAGSSFLSQKEELENSNAEILRDYPADAMAEKIRIRMEKESRITSITDIAGTVGTEGGKRPAGSGKTGRPGIFAAVPLLAAAALVMAVVLPLTLGRTETGVREDNAATVRLKGLEPHLKIYRKTGEHVDLLKNNSPVKTGDLLQLSYVSGSRKYGAILSIDGNGFVTLHYPAGLGESMELQTAGEIPLDFSYQLDNAPGFERFFFITSDSYFSLTGIMDEAARMAGSYYGARNGNLPVPGVCDTESILLVKEN